ncbi:MAG: DNA polymerase III subunit gamma/tau [Chloroflexi bacterium]|nr:DNA polymerase III subunit gamma/tau [Chloroflexota bacterium]
MSQALYLRWRPKTWDEVVGQEHVIKTLRSAIKNERISHAYLFAGPRGTGKTTTARLLAKAVNCLAETFSQRPDNTCSPCEAVNQSRFLDLIEIDAASNTSVEDVRDLREKIHFSPNEGRYKVYIIDEVHMLSTAAFNALLKTLEEPPAHAIFILATTEVHKIPSTVLSRCQRHEFRRISVSTIKEYIKEKSEEVGLQIEDSAIELIARQATGSLRDAISLLDLLSSSGELVTLVHARAVLGTVSGEAVQKLVSALTEQDAKLGLQTINAALNRGADSRQFAREMVDHLRGVLLAKMGNMELIEASNDIREAMIAAAKLFSLEKLLSAIKAFNKAALERRQTWIPSLELELAFLEVLRIGEGSNSNPTLPEADPPLADRQPRAEIPPELPTATVMQTTQSDYAEVRRLWKEILKTTRGFDPRTQALLNSGSPIGLEDGVLTLGFRSDLLREKMEKDQNIANAQRALQQVLGHSIQLRCVLLSSMRAAEQRGEDPPDVEEGGMVATAVRDFGAHVVDVEKAPPEN